MPSVSWRSPNTLKPTEALHQKEAETSFSATKVDPTKDVIECLFKGHITDIDWLGKLSCTFKSLRGQRPGPAFHDQDKNHIIPLESKVWLTDGLCSSAPWCTPFEDCDHLKVGSQSLVSLLKRQTTTPGTVPDFYVSAKTLQQHPENWETHAASHSPPGDPASKELFNYLIDPCPNNGLVLRLCFLYERPQTCHSTKWNYYPYWVAKEFARIILRLKEYLAHSPHQIPHTPVYASATSKSHAPMACWYLPTASRVSQPNQTWQNSFFSNFTSSVHHLI